MMRTTVLMLDAYRLLLRFRETDGLCTDLLPELATRIEMRGAHHFSGDYTALAKRIVADLEGQR